MSTLLHLSLPDEADGQVRALGRRQPHAGVCHRAGGRRQPVGTYVKIRPCHSKAKKRRAQSFFFIRKELKIRKKEASEAFSLLTLLSALIYEVLTGTIFAPVSAKVCKRA